MNEYFCVTNSFAAPFFSDLSIEYVKADSPEQAMDILRAEYKHPMGLYAARVYEGADVYHKTPADFSVEWLSKKAKEDMNL